MDSAGAHPLAMHLGGDMADADKPELLPNGKWSYRGIEFASEEAAMSFKRSRDEGPSFAA